MDSRRISSSDLPRSVLRDVTGGRCGVHWPTAVCEKGSGASRYCATTRNVSNEGKSESLDSAGWAIPLRQHPSAHTRRIGSPMIVLGIILLVDRLLHQPLDPVHHRCNPRGGRNRAVDPRRRRSPRRWSKGLVLARYSAFAFALGIRRCVRVCRAFRCAHNR